MQPTDILARLFMGRGGEIYASALSVIDKNRMSERISSGVLLGLSGGADSVMLLCFLLEYRERVADFPLLCVHINHGIRGEEADCDERFSRELATSLGVEFTSVRLDVPAIARSEGIGIEEAARNARYSVFADIISSRNDINSIAVAHNADDNAETVLLNIMRGAGSRGASGIPVVRDNIIRPLISVSKADIVSSLTEAGIPFVTDSTNLSSDYSRNYVRHEIIPRLCRLSDNPEQMFSRLCANLRSDDDFITREAEKILRDREEIPTAELYQLHEALFVRVLSIMAGRVGAGISVRILSDIRENLGKDNFSYSLIGGRFIAEGGIARVIKQTEDPYTYRFLLRDGTNSLAPFSAELILSDKEFEKTYSNVHKNSIQADISSAIIVGSLYLRPKEDGDSIFYGGMTHKLKKLFNDRKIPPSKRRGIPILCDDKGVVWVPGFGARDDGAKNACPRYATLIIDKDGESPRLYSGAEFSK